MRTVFGIPISQISMDDLCDRLAVLAELREGTSTVCLVNSQSLVEAHRDPSHMASLLDADLCAPDGWPIAALARTRRIAGADLMLAAARHPTLGRVRHVLLGGFGVAYLAAVRQWTEAGGDVLVRKPWVPEVDSGELVRMANATPCEILWLALGCPKQEAWMRDHRHEVTAKVVIGVGAAFNYLAGTVRRAPVWMQRCGLEGVFRIGSEPARWRRPVGAGIGLIQLLLGFRPR